MRILRTRYKHVIGTSRVQLLQLVRARLGKKERYCNWGVHLGKEGKKTERAKLMHVYTYICLSPPRLALTYYWSNKPAGLFYVLYLNMHCF